LEGRPGPFDNDSGVTVPVREAASCQARLHSSKVQLLEREGTSKVNGTRVARRLKVTGGGKGVGSYAGDPVPE
jgi:hypothetical protein